MKQSNQTEDHTTLAPANYESAAIVLHSLATAASELIEASRRPENSANSAFLVDAAENVVKVGEGLRVISSIQ